MSADPAVPVLDLRGERTPVWSLLRDAARHRDLLVMLAAQDYRSRYRSAALGLLWSVALPLLQGLVIAVVFSHFAGGGLNHVYVPYVIVGITLWSYVQQSMGSASTSIVDNGAIAGKIYFPRLILPGIAPSANLPGLVISLGVAEVVSLVAGAGLHPTILLAPVAVALAWLLVVAAAALATLVHVYSRDMRYIVQAGLLVLFYATPIIYFLSGGEGGRALPESIRPFVLANPATGLVQLMRCALIGQADELGTALAWTVGWIVVLAGIACVAYSRLERIACDRL